MHSIALETNQSIECLEAELSCLVSFTTDLGTEASIPDFRCVSPLELMPSWMRQAYEGIDPDLAAQAVEPADAFPEADIEVDEQAIAETQAQISCRMALRIASRPFQSHSSRYA